MSFDGAKLIWHNGQMIPWEQATVHVMAHALHYGSSVFEGIRVYKTPDGPKVFRLTAHIQRLFDSALIHRISVPFDLPTLIAACKEVVSANELLDGAYIRHHLFAGGVSVDIVEAGSRAYLEVVNRILRRRERGLDANSANDDVSHATI